jgi:putative tryptophan/tyrosine transport system substrate-binding protein
MRRRDFIKAIAGSTAATWPLLARAQQGERARRIGVLMNVPENESNGQARFAAFLQGMQQLGWSDGRNLRIDTRWGGNDARMRKSVAELVALAPEAHWHFSLIHWNSFWRQC